jgi:soluble lytic murein transglycosylase
MPGFAFPDECPPNSNALSLWLRQNKARHWGVMLSLTTVDSMHFPMKFLLFALLLIPLVAVADQDADYLAARDAFRAGNAVRFDHIAVRLKNSPLEPYLAYYRLRLQLETADASAIQAFLARPDDTPVIDRMRGEWLKLLGKKHQWDAFAAEYPHLLNEDTELSCYALQARRHTQENEALQEARKLWLSGNDDLPESCTPLFDAALANGVISEADVWLRVRLALEAGNVSLARQLSVKLPLERRLSATALNSAAADPQRYLSKASLDNVSEAERRVALFALQRLAKQLPQLAFAQWEKVAAHFNVEEQHYFYAWLGYEAALRQDARALEWFKAAGGAPLTDQQRAWRARAALRAMDWLEVRVSIATMSPQQQQEDVWRYWNARALKHLGQADESKKILLAMSTEYHFYGQLAADELGMPVASGPMPAGYQPSKEELDAMLAQPPIQRTLALYRMNLRTDALREWAWAIRKFDDKQLLIAAEIARRNQMYDRAINTADRTVQLHDFSLRYLAPYRNNLRGHIQQNQLEEAWVYGLMRQESRFVSQAKSNVGAAGLMQVMPATARWIARKLGMKDYRKMLVGNLETNLILGTYYMKTVLGWFDNNPVLASAAYNAGPSRARRWRGDIPLEGAVYTETIPFPETRDYVKKVMSNTVYYAQQFGQPPRSLKQRLGIIAAKNPANQTPIPDEK